jgi:hypothetical protein
VPRRIAIVILPLVALLCALAETARRSFSTDPANPEWWADRAALLDQAGDDPGDAWRHAAELAPRVASYRSRLGIAEEAAGDFAAAERDLTLASGLSRKFEPHWNLLNFYFRRARWRDFWRETPVALRASYGDRAPLFDLLTRGEGGTLVLPADRSIRAAYVSFLLGRSEYAHAVPEIEELAAAPNADDLPAFRGWIESFLAARHSAEAARIWTILQQRGLIREDPFPWRVNEVAGITIHQPSPGAWQIILSGEQPEHCELLSRIVPASRGRHVCVLTNEISAPVAGLSWRSDPYDPDSVRLVLTYDRPAGAMRAEVNVEMRKIVIGECK